MNLLETRPRTMQTHLGAILIPVTLLILKCVPTNVRVT